VRIRQHPSKRLRTTQMEAPVARAEGIGSSTSDESLEVRTD
jgi:hypothetical protein